MPLILPKILKAVLASTQKASHRSNATILIKKKQTLLLPSSVLCACMHLKQCFVTAQVASIP